MHRIFPLGTGCAPFRSFIEERMSQSAGGKLKLKMHKMRTGAESVFKIVR